ncbi:TPA: NADP oxidoreductase [Candidatus Delongbacteria bacterium]|nr:MAG: hypothetical protein A2Y39_04430 [Candidatus Delongbacteria bacterium GWF2_40_14]HAQ62160.1 NADP oxidoreductase [Candidatus Delongbacteria bacterium]
MKAIKSIGDLKTLTEKLKIKSSADKKKVQICIAMATCSIASGSGKVMEFFKEEMPKQPFEFMIRSTGCMGLCHSEPTVEVTLPDSDPVVFGKVDVKRARSIIEDYIKTGKTIDGVIEGN